MQDLLLLLSTLGFFAAGLLVPFVMSLGYVWVDMFSPHIISESLLSSVPVSMLFAVAAVGLYLVKDRKEPPKFSAITGIQIALCIWITLTSTWAVSPANAWWRWDLAIKVAFFSAFLPYVIRSRVQIEALALVYFFSIAAHTVPWGVKTILTGGGYNQALGLMRSNQSLLEESSVISAVAVMMVPFALVWRKHSVILPKTRLVSVAMWAIIVLSLICSIGTFARTALVAFGVCGGSMWLRSKNKLTFLVVGAVLGLMMFGVMSDRWLNRINTVNDYQSDSSAFVRIIVWRWAIDFTMSHPFGGGFWAYVVNRIEVPMPDGSVLVQYSRAWHNIFIAALAEHGFPGFALYVTMIGMVIATLQKVQRLTKRTVEHLWCAEFAQALQVCLVTLFVCGNFVEFGWQPVIWYLFSMAVALREYVRRAISVPSAVQRTATPGFVPNPPTPAFGRTLARRI